MNEQDKREIGEIVAAAIVQHGGCPHGVNAATAHELIDFATTWRHCKRTAIGAFIVTLIGAAGTAIWAGVKALAHVGTPLFLLAGALLLAAGCSTDKLVESVSQKSVSLRGYGAVNLIDTGYNPATGTTTPSLNSIVGSTHYKSTIVARPEGTETPDYIDYAREESASFWNSKAKSTTTSFTITASGKEAMQFYLMKIAEMERQRDTAATAAEK